MKIAVIGVAFVLSLACKGWTEVPRPEHPRPDAVRENWMTLNGEWQFEIDAKGDGEVRGLVTGQELSSKIVVSLDSVRCVTALARDRVFFSTRGERG